jgi:hypothetical protein
MAFPIRRQATMVEGAVGLLLGLFGGLALRPVLDAYVLWRAARELQEHSDSLPDVDVSWLQDQER